eukprot:XP_003964360.1 PREDICTED: uncharacterized protein LOC101065967 [Takifugu rubripes]
MTFDDEEELRKVSRCHPKAKLVLRIAVDDSSSFYRLSLKFGAGLSTTGRLLECAAELGLEVVGVSFHIGSKCSQSLAFRQAIADARSIFDTAKLLGFQFSLLDIGGGFSGKDFPVTLQEFSEVINGALDEYFPFESGVQVIAEPGRYYVESPFTLAANVIAKRVIMEDMRKEGAVVFQRLSGWLASDAMVLGGGSGDPSRLTRRYGVKVGARSLYTVEEVALAVGEVIGHGSVKSAARMNRAVVVFVEKVEQVNRLVEAGISVGGRFEAVLPLSQPATKVTLSNVPPFITDEFLCRELSRHGKIVSPMRKVMSGCKSPLLKHVVSHRRQVYMIDEDLNVCFKVRVDDFDYIVFASSAHTKCFGCNEAGHLIKMCPNGANRLRRARGSGPEPLLRSPARRSPELLVSDQSPEPRDDGATTPVGSDGNTGEGEQFTKKRLLAI